jgi:hypothetical protein
MTKNKDGIIIRGGKETLQCKAVFLFRVAALRKPLCMTRERMLFAFSQKPVFARFNSFVAQPLNMARLAH